MPRLHEFAGSVLAWLHYVLLGSAGKVSPDVYVSKVCSALGTWEKSVQAQVPVLQRAASATAAAHAKTAFLNFFDAVEFDAHTARSALIAAGTPNVSSGASEAATLRSAFTAALKAIDSVLGQFRGQLNHLRTGLFAGLSTASASSRGRAAMEIGQSVEGLVGAVAAFEGEGRLRGDPSGLLGVKAGVIALDPTLSAAAARSSACTSLDDFPASAVFSALGTIPTIPALQPLAGSGGPPGRVHPGQVAP